VRLVRAISVRLLFGVLSLLFISFVTFVAGQYAGDPAVIIAGDKATPEAIERLRHNMGLDKPWPIRYGRFVSDIAHGDFGTSYYGTKEPVRDILARDMPMTAQMALCAILVASTLGVLFGVVAAVYENRFGDRAVLFFSTLGVTLPNFVLGPILVLIFAVWLNRLPITWDVHRVAPDYMYLILPVSMLALRPTALLTRVTRASMIETLQQEFIRLATAKGVPPLRLIFRHALRNAILPVVTTIGTSFGFLLTGAFAVERLFALPGIGKETIDAIQQSNHPVVQACILVTGALFILVNLGVDLLLPILDPRIRESQV
jgi:peptide/nickel transport system permease protein